jgi:hypothetical protein
MTTYLTPMCYSCVHLNPGELTCTAFPQGIPDEILDGRVDHRKPMEGDGGILFEQSPDSPVPPFEMYPFASKQALVSSLRERVHRR